MGISVKSRSRIEKTKADSVNINREDTKKAEKACEIFKCTSYFAIIIDAVETIYAFITSLEPLLKIFPPKKKASYWSISGTDLERLRNDKNVKMFELKVTNIRW